ncbi:MAG: 50S ribosomal protein L10 [Bacteroidales bacterium]|jgi:large subunit ribosomal protein L10|nr:50S ribosomal protein L10 [Bacteroidales bacterium]MDD2264127.1 50S ribosomal protein L10 [Bacteroidales bacterium]MDD2831402.1 50S ribosomal protein L10 [Bacteroidales bacterium]MDD3208396.1 50S ribosomal protein L10 [Bacteroidales bacterium]MDD3696921.1 50S ribosomal protein L10 [Bacteroidales bacterium]
MKKEQKGQIIEGLADQLKATPDFYVVDIDGLNAEKTSRLRRECFAQNIKLVVVKNTLLKRTLEQAGIEEMKLLFPILEGSTAVMFTENVNAPARLIKLFGQENGKPVLKGALIQECAYIGEDQLENLINIKSREELIGDIAGLILSPAQRLLSAVEAAGSNMAGIVKTLAERE